MAETAMSAAFRRQGIRPEIVEFTKALARLLNSGGTIDDAREVVENAAKKLSGEGHSSAAGDGHGKYADARQPNGSEAGLTSGAPGGHFTGARPLPPVANGEGRIRRAEGQIDVAQPVREPSKADKSAARHVAQTIALTVLDTDRVRDGRSIGTVKRGELRSLIGANEYEAALLTLIRDRIDSLKPNSSMAAPLKELLEVKEYQRLKQKAAEIANA